MRANSLQNAYDDLETEKLDVSLASRRVATESEWTGNETNLISA